jgi:hypothetical protein
MIPAASLELGIVVAVYPQGQSIDVLLPDSGSRLTNVQVMGSGSDNTGTVDLPDPGLPADDTRWNITNNAPRNIIAVIASYQGNPVCLGFLLPQIGQMTFADKNRRIMRHASDVYSSIDQHANAEFYHPSGSFWRIGTAPAHEDLTGLDFDGEWAIVNNTAAAVYLNVTLANGGVVKAKLQIDPAGNVTLNSTTLVVTAPTTINGATVVNGATTVNGASTLNGNVSVAGNTTQTGNQTVSGSMTVSGTVSAAAIISGGGGGSAPSPVPTNSQSAAMSGMRI